MAPFNMFSKQMYGWPLMEILFEGFTKMQNKDADISNRVVKKYP